MRIADLRWMTAGLWLAACASGANETGEAPLTTSGSSGAAATGTSTTDESPTSTSGPGDTTSTGTASGSTTGTTDASESSGEPPTGSESSTGEPLPDGMRRFRFFNQCEFTVWVGTIGNPIAPAVNCASDADCGPDQVCDPGNTLCTWRAPDGGGWPLPASESYQVVLPAAWGGRFWPRTGCDNFNEQGVPACQTGDCGGHLQCPTGVGGTPPATLAEFTLIPPDAPVGLDFYDVSNVDGSNIPVRIDAAGGSFTPAPPPGANAMYYCGSPGCTGDCGAFPPCPWDLAVTCPPELQVLIDGVMVGCRSAGQGCAIDPANPALNCAQNNDLYGCVPGGPNMVEGSCYSEPAAATCCGCPSWSPEGECNNNNPAWQLPSAPETYAKVFKDACPTAYSFPYDDPTSTFTCQGTPERNVEYDITFCP